jgi:hypothetical protein
MKHSLRSRNAANLSESISRHLNMYALAASAAGVGMLALAQPAQAKIVYTKAHSTVPINTLLPLDLNHDGVNDLSFTIAAGGKSSFLFAYNLRSNGVGGEVGSFQFASALKPGAHIGAGRKFLSGSKPDLLWGIWASTGAVGSTGRWRDANNRYLGVKFSIKGKTHYGWVRLSVSLPPGIDAVITGYAYETIPNKAIIAGRTKGVADKSVEAHFGPGSSLANPLPDSPQPASLGALAMGAPGLSIWRREDLVSARQ